MHGAEPPASPLPSPQSGPSPVLLISTPPAAATTTRPTIGAGCWGSPLPSPSFVGSTTRPRTLDSASHPAPLGFSPLPLSPPQLRPSSVDIQTWPAADPGVPAHSLTPAPGRSPAIELSMAPLSPQDETLTTGPELTTPGLHPHFFTALFKKVPRLTGYLYASPETAHCFSHIRGSAPAVSFRMEGVFHSFTG